MMFRCSLFLSLFAIAGCAFGQVDGETNVSVGQTVNYVFITSHQPGDLGEWSAGPNEIASGQLAPVGGVGARGSVRYLVAGNTTVMCCLRPSGTCGSLNVTVHPGAPQVTPAVICNGGVVTVSADLQGTGGSEIRWYTSVTGGSSIASGTQLTQIISSTTTYYAAAYSTLGGESLTRTAVTATIVTPPTTSPIVTGTECIGAGRTMTLHASGAGSGESYKWVKNTQIVSTNADYSTTSPAATTSNYVSVRLTTPPGCDGPPTSVTVTVYPFPVIQGSGIAMGEPARLICNADYDRYEWYLGANPTPVKVSTTQSDNALVTIVTGTYVVKVVKGNASATSALFVLGTQLEGQNLNYITSNAIQVSGVTSSSQVGGLTKESNAQSVQYFDGLGRPMQTVVTQGSPIGNDMVQPIVYDAFGREVIQYLPYVSSETSGWFKDTPLGTSDYTTSDQFMFYNDPDTEVAQDLPYSKTVFEPSPLNRVVKQGAAGQSWQPNLDPDDNSDRVLHKSYGVNIDDDVLLFFYDQLNDALSAGDANGLDYYIANDLKANKTVDENQNEIIEYVDKSGRTVCKRVQYGTQGSVKQYASTYYIYDDSNKLILVLPPEAIVEILKQY